MKWRPGKQNRNGIPPAKTSPTRARRMGKAGSSAKKADMASWGEGLDHKIDFSALQPAPDKFDQASHLFLEDDAPLEAATEVNAHIRNIASRLHSRQAILQSLATIEYDPKRISEMVIKDPFLASQVLRTVNSAYYSLERKVASVFRAIILLGHLEVRNIVWRSCFTLENTGTDKIGGYFAEALWRHSFAVSRVAFALARRFGLPEPDRISTSGLLHDIGKLILLDIDPKLALRFYDPVRFTRFETLTKEHQEETNHARLGAEAAKSWGLPADTCCAVRHHHVPSYMQPRLELGDLRSIAIVHLADLVCHVDASSCREEVEQVIYTPQPGWLKPLGVASLEELFTSEIVAIIRRSMSRMGVGTDEDREGVASRSEAVKPEKVLNE